MRLKRVLPKSKKSWIKKNCFHVKKILRNPIEVVTQVLQEKKAAGFKWGAG